jgi:ribonucleotide reductase alpha subunit
MGRKKRKAAPAILPCLAVDIRKVIETSKASI